MAFPRFLELTDREEQDLAIGSTGIISSILERMEAGQSVRIYGNHISRGTKPLEDYVSMIREIGIDISKSGEHQYGYHMPLPEKGKTTRNLVIVKRR